jgi:hypothetical protein
MNRKGFLAATLIGAVVLYGVGFVVFGLALANAYTPTVIDREAPLFLWMLPAELAWAALLAFVLINLAAPPSPASGFKVGLVAGFLDAVSMAFAFYALTTLPISTMSFVEPVVWAAVSGVGGAAVGWSLARSAAPNMG